MGSYIERLQPPRNKTVYKVGYSAGMHDNYYEVFKKCGDKISNNKYNEEYGEELWAITEEGVMDELLKAFRKLQKLGFDHKLILPEKSAPYDSRKQHRLNKRYQQKAWEQLDNAFDFEKDIPKKHWNDIANLKMLQQLYIDCYHGGFIYQIESPQ